MSAIEQTQTTTQGDQQPKAIVRERSPIRCPHCRAVDPEIKYGELAYYTQTFIPESADWAGDGELGETDGSYTTDACCTVCDGDITTYLIGWSKRNPDHAPYAGFAHEVYIPRGLPLRRNSQQFLAGMEWSCGTQYQGAFLQPSDEELKSYIALYKMRLGAMLDEQTERARLKAVANG
jgi:hypothetical protein